jgi:hypothetical protein
MLRTCLCMIGEKRSSFSCQRTERCLRAWRCTLARSHGVRRNRTFFARKRRCYRPPAAQRLHSVCVDRTDESLHADCRAGASTPFRDGEQER